MEGRKRRGRQDEMFGWHHQLSGHAFEQALGDGGGQEAWVAAVHGVTKSQTGLSDFHFHIYICVCMCVYIERDGYIWVYIYIYISSVQSLSRVRPFATP